MSAVKSLIEKFSGPSNPEDSSFNKNKQSNNFDETHEATNAPQQRTTEPTRHAEHETGDGAAEPKPPTSTHSTPHEPISSARDESAKEETGGQARDTEALGDGAPAHLIPNSEHYHASSNVQHILDDAEKADAVHRPKEGDEASAAKDDEAAPQKPDKAKGHPEQDNSAKSSTAMSDGPGQTTAESGYRPSKNVKHIIDDAEKADEEHNPDGHSFDQDEEAKKMDNPTAGATNASHPNSEQSAAQNSDKREIETRNDDEPAQTTTESGYTPSDNVKQILEKAEKAADANNNDDHDVDISNHKKLDEPTANMSVHANSRNEE